MRHRWALALTEVLKVIAEDKASKTVDKITASMVRMGVIGEASSAKFGRKLENMFGDVIVGGAVAATQALTAFAAAGVAALGALAYKSVEAQLKFDKMREAYGGGTSEFLGASRDLEGAYDTLQQSISKLLIDGLDLPRHMSDFADQVVRISDAIDEGKLQKWAQIITTMAPKIGFLGGGFSAVGAAASGLAGATGGAGAAGAAAAGAAKYGNVIRLPTFGIKARDPETIRKEKEKAAKEAADAERKRAISALQYEEMITKARQEIANNNQLAAIERDQRDQQTAEKQKQALKERMALEKQASEENKRAAQEVANLANSVGQSFGGLFRQIMQGGMSAMDVLLSVLGVGVSIAGNFLAPGAGAAGSAALGFLGSLFNEGGVARAANGMRVPGVGAGDRVPALLERGEVVIPNGASHPSFIDEVARAAGGGGGHTTVNLSQGYLVPPDSVTAQRNYQRGLVPVLNDLHSTGRGSVTNPRFRGTAGGRKRG